MLEQDRKDLEIFSRNEITEHYIYLRLAAREKDAHNRAVLEAIAADEKRHYELIKEESGVAARPDRRRIIWYSVLAKALGLTFAVKLMESGEDHAAGSYRAFSSYPKIAQLADEEDAHEAKLIALINEERLAYMSSVILGLSDALVEFTGALAGFTLALANSKLIALTGAITGIAAALSMASSEYLSSKTEKDRGKKPLKAAVYTGGAYIITVALLVAPFACLNNVFAALGLMLFFALLLIAGFMFYYSVARGESFKHRFVEMTCLSFGVAAVSFLIGYALKTFTGIEA